MQPCEQIKYRNYIIPSVNTYSYPPGFSHIRKFSGSGNRSVVDAATDVRGYVRRFDRAHIIATFNSPRVAAVHCGGVRAVACKLLRVMHMERYVMKREHLKKKLTRKHFQNSLTKRLINTIILLVVVDLYNPYEVRLTVYLIYWGEQDYTIRHIFLINDGSNENGKKTFASSGQGLNKMEQNNVCCHGSFLFLLLPGMPRRDAPVLCLSALLFGYPLCKPAQNLVY
ncbi:hypothetical protein ALC53_08506 [Atta colombica]|uniref:Uncharacterized protein n=1 Tax=Atta colombica TaxID=520822 RepID=A0A195B9E8_9HYME|nr:hypothetical protein ALC53_08506 [Atta colombica]